MKELISPATITESILIGFIQAGLLLAAVYLFPLLLIIYPVPLVIAFVRRGPLHTLLAQMVSFTLVYLFTDLGTALSVVAVGLPIALIVGVGIVWHRSTFAVVCIGSAWLLTVGVGIVAYYHFIAKVDLIGVFETVFRSAMTEGMASLEPLTRDTTLSVPQLIDATLNALIVSLPAYTLLWGAAFTFINRVVAGRWLRKSGIDIPTLGKFNTFAYPPSLKWGVVLIALTIWAFQAFGFAFWRELNLNMVTLGFMLFTVDGLAVADAFGERRVGPIVRVIIPVFVIIVLQGLNLYAILGAIDLFVNLRSKGGFR